MLLFTLFYFLKISDNYITKENILKCTYPPIPYTVFIVLLCMFEIPVQAKHQGTYLWENVVMPSVYLWVSAALGLQRLHRVGRKNVRSNTFFEDSLKHSSNTHSYRRALSFEQSVRPSLTKASKHWVFEVNPRRWLRKRGFEISEPRWTEIVVFFDGVIAAWLWSSECFIEWYKSFYSTRRDK